MLFRSALTLACTAGLLAACSSADDEAQESAATPAPQMTQNPVATAAPDGSALAEGSWTVEENPTGASAAFGPPASKAMLVLACDRPSGVLTLTRTATSDAQGTQKYVIEAGGQAASLDMTATGDAMPTLRAEIAPDAPVFAALDRAGGTFSMTAPDGSVLHVPSAPGIFRVFEACK